MPFRFPLRTVKPSCTLI